MTSNQRLSKKGHARPKEKNGIHAMRDQSLEELVHPNRVTEAGERLFPPHRAWALVEPLWGLVRWPLAELDSLEL